MSFTLCAQPPCVVFGPTIVGPFFFNDLADLVSVLISETTEIIISVPCKMKVRLLKCKVWKDISHHY